MDKKEYFECICACNEHTIVWDIMEDENEPPELGCTYFLHQWRGFFQRAWVAIKYVFGYKCHYGHFDCFILKPEDFSRFIALVDAYAKKHNKWTKENIK